MSWYYALTTLATIGYGDLSPVNTNERVVSIFIMLVGVGVFSYVTGSFTDLVANYDKNMGIDDNNPKLQNWIVLLKNFSNNKKKTYDINILNKIETHYAHFWKNDRNFIIKKTDPYFVALPNSIKKNLIYFLWKDVFIQFQNFFQFWSENRIKPEHKKLYYDLSFLLIPRM